jgi:hypothetical protein
VTGRHSFSKLLAKHRGIRRRLVCSAVSALIATAWLTPPIAGHQQVNARAAALKDFTDRIADYVALQKRLESTLKQSPTDDPAQIDVRRKALAEAIRAARPRAKRGEVFGAAGAQFREIIRRDARERSVRDVYAAMQEVPLRSPIRVNVDYPEKAALATVPPLILKQLPPLPDGIEFRFMGRDLILRDANANLIIDFIHEAVPTIRRR